MSRTTADFDKMLDQMKDLEQRIKLVNFLRKMSPGKFKSPSSIDWAGVLLAQKYFSKL